MWGKFEALAATEGANGQWPGRILADDKKRDSFAEKVIKDLDWACMGVPVPRPKKLQLFPKEARLRLIKGMYDGCIKIIVKAKQKRLANKASQGLQERETIIYEAAKKGFRSSK
jgi:hypothetical protein